MQKDQLNPVGWFEIYVSDMQRAVTFYHQVLGLETELLPAPDALEMEMRAFSGGMTASGANGALVKMNAVSGGPGGVIIYFETEDCAVSEAKVVPAGGKVCQPKMSIGAYGFCSIVSDTEGNVIGFHSMK